MPKYPGRIVSATPPSVSLSGASGVWTLEEVAQYEQAGTWPVGVVSSDPNFNQTVLLLHGDGTNGAQNNTFLDGSTNNFTITRNPATGPNAPTQGTFSPFSLAAGEWSNFFDGTSDNLVLPSSSNLAFGTGDFCVEAWVYWTSSGVLDAIFSNLTSSTNEATQFNIQLTTGNKVQVTGWTTVFLTGATNVISNAWNHIAVCRTGTTLSIFLNGSRDATTTSSNNWSSTNAFYVGDYPVGGAAFSGYISNLRAIKGSHPYDATQTTLTVPTAPLTAITNTSLLTCQSNRFVDNSSNNFTLTRAGDVRVTPFSPFAPSAAYDPAVNGGSGYFVSAIGNYLSAGTSTTLALGAGDFCIECWIYLLAYNSNTSIIFDYRTNGSSPSNIPALALQTNGQPSFYFQVSSPVINGSKVVPLNTWTHLAVVRNGSSTNNCTMYMNGESIGTATNTSNLGIQTLAINSPQTGTNYNSNAYFADFRIVTGSPVYTGAFTPPTAPLTAITNTKLLLNFTNAGIFDNTGKNNLETVVDAQIDTTTKKYGTGSMEFDGTGDYLLLPHNPDQQLGTGNFTIEFWVYLASGDTGSARGLVANGTSTTGWLVSLDSSQKVVFTYTTSTITSSGAITTNAWNYIAVVREGTGSNQTKIYIGGVNDGTGTVSTDFNQTSVMYVGANRTGGDAMKGFIDDLRITKGIARTISVPGSAFPDL